MAGIDIFGKYGFYDQIRKQYQTTDVLFEENNYRSLAPTHIIFTIKISENVI